MPVDLPPAYPPPPPAIEISIGEYKPRPPFPEVTDGPLFPSDESSVGCPRDTYRVIVPFGMTICRIDPANTSVQPTGVSNSETNRSILNKLNWAKELIERYTKKYPEALHGTGVVKIITIDPSNANSTYFGWGQVVRVGEEESAVVTTQHVMDDENFLYLLLNENGYVVKTSSQIIRIPAGGSLMTDDSSVNLAMLLGEEVDRLLPNRVDMVGLGAYDEELPAYLLNTVSDQFPVFTGIMIPVIVGRREDQTLIIMLRQAGNGSINNLCVGVSGTPIIQFLPKSDTIGTEAVVVAFASSLPPEDISNSPVNPALGRRCAPANTALRVPRTASEHLDITNSSIREWGRRSNYTWLKTHTMRSQG